ncbi:hypothetical protein DM558_13750 [Entomomonas moraniae]|uniref:Uncharacterized protein n=1 Tax=Entomomonas moraniae TaxID=2213226 RepID=A0A451EPM9_9GAMM|nr:hypothetical protein [Entomomonas moraniae]AZS51764.1 hypothetical protein DM558_13750 [Entomomonas moraniae]
MAEKLTIFLLSFFSVLTYANSVNIVEGSAVGIKNVITSGTRVQVNKQLLSADKLPEVSKYDKEKDPLFLGKETQNKQDVSNGGASVLPNLFDSHLPPSFSVQGRFIEKENMSREGSDIEGAAVKFIFVQ